MKTRCAQISETAHAEANMLVVQTYWLLLAVSQDQPKNKYVAELRDCCERAALEGSWVRHLETRNNMLVVGHAEDAQADAT